MNKMMRYAKLIIPALVAVFFSPAAMSAACTSKATGNWSAAATWNAPCNVAGGPVATDTVTIGAAHTITIDVNAAATSIAVSAPSGATNGVTLAASVTLNVSGAVTMAAPTANNRTSTFVVGSGTLNAGSITISGGTSGTRISQMTVSTGTITVTGAVTNGGTPAQSRFISTGASTVTIGGNFAPGAFTPGASTVTVSGNFTPTAMVAGTGTVIFTGGAAQNIGAYTTYNNVVIAKAAGTASLLGTTTIRGTLTVSTGTLTVGAFALTVNGATTVNGTLNITSATGAKTFTGAVTINLGGVWNNSGNAAVALKGNFTNNGTFTSGTGIYTFSGTAAQTITGTTAGTTTFGRVTLNNASGLVLGGTHNVTVNTTLTLTNGIVTTNANILTIANGSAIGGASAARFVVGNLRKPYPTGATTRNFEVGTTVGGNRYARASLAFTGVTTAGNITVSSTAGSHPQLGTSGLDNITPHKLNRYWTISNSGVVFTSYSATFTFVAADVDAGANALAFIAMRYSPAAPAAGTWNPTTKGAGTTTTLQVTGETGFGDFTVGEALGYNATLGRFNAYDPPPLTTAGSVQGYIRTKIAGAAFSLTVVHLNVAGTALANFGGGTTAVTVALIDGTTTTGAFTNNCWANWLAAPAIQSVTINFAAAANTGTAAFAAVPNSYKDVRVRITGGGQTGCSGDRFAIRPNSMTVVASDKDWVTATPFARVLNNAVANGGVVHKAGQPFAISATAYNAAATPAITTNYNGSPTVKTIACTLPSPTCTSGTLTPGTWLADPGPSPSGKVTTSTATYSEVGAFNLTLEDMTYANVDTPDTTLVQRTIPQTAAAAVGRFVPDHFAVATNNVPKLKTFNAACAVRSFTYIGQPFGYVTAPQALVTAQNAGNATTANYTSTLWKLATAAGTQDCTTNPDICTLTSGSVTQTYTYSTTPAATPNWGSTQVVLGMPAIVAGTIALGTNGTGTVTSASGDQLAFKRSLTTPQALFTASIALTDSVKDVSEAGNCGVAGAGACDITTATPAQFNPIAFDSGNEFRYGRLKLANAYGSELLKLPISIQTQYWKGTGFVTNAADNCTTLAASNIKLTTPPAGVSATMGGTFSSGVGSLALSKPTTPAHVAVDLCVDLGPDPGGGTVCSATSANMQYLQGVWAPGSSYNNDPVARSTFGVYKGSNEFIYLREAY